MNRELLRQTLHTMERYQSKSGDFDRFADEIAALREELAKFEQVVAVKVISQHTDTQSTS